MPIRLTRVDSDWLSRKKYSRGLIISHNKSFTGDYIFFNSVLIFYLCLSNLRTSLVTGEVITGLCSNIHFKTDSFDLFVGFWLKSIFPNLRHSY